MLGDDRCHDIIYRHLALFIMKTTSIHKSLLKRIYYRIVIEQLYIASLVAKELL